MQARRDIKGLDDIPSRSAAMLQKTAPYQRKPHDQRVNT
jgi:hypothetical protein